MVTELYFPMVLVLPVKI